MPLGIFAELALVWEGHPSLNLLLPLALLQDSTACLSSRNAPHTKHVALFGAGFDCPQPLPTWPCFHACALCRIRLPACSAHIVRRPRLGPVLMALHRLPSLPSRSGFHAWVLFAGFDCLLFACMMRCAHAQRLISGTDFLAAPASLACFCAWALMQDLTASLLRPHCAVPCPL